MKAVLTNKFTHEGTAFNIQSTYRAKFHDGVWIVFLDHHLIEVQNEDSEYPVLKIGFALSSSRIDDILSLFLTTLELYGIVMSAIDLLRQLLEALTDVRSLMNLIASWVKTLLDDQEAQQTVDQSLQDASFVLNLLKDGAVLMDGRHRWRKKLSTTWN